jgi:hypothetical protein
MGQSTDLTTPPRGNTVGGFDAVNLQESIDDTVLFVAETTGFYTVMCYLAQVGLSASNDGSVGVSLGFTDEVGTTPTSMDASLWSLPFTDAFVGNNSVIAENSFAISLYAIAGSPVVFSTTYVPPTTPPTGYNIHIRAIRL